MSVGRLSHVAIDSLPPPLPLALRVLLRRIYLTPFSWGDGWEAAEATIKLSSWTKQGRVVVVREAPAIAPVGGRARRRRDPFEGELRGAKGERLEDQIVALWSGRIAVLSTSLNKLDCLTTAMPKQYRDRGDAGDNYDELKNQWAGVDIPRTNSQRAASWRTSSPCFTTGGTAMHGSTMKTIIAKPIAPVFLISRMMRCLRCAPAPVTQRLAVTKGLSEANLNASKTFVSLCLHVSTP